MRHSSIQRPGLPPTTSTSIDSQKLLFSRSKPFLNRSCLPSRSSGSCHIGKLDARPCTFGVVEEQRVRDNVSDIACSNGEQRCRTAPQTFSSNCLPIRRSLSSNNTVKNTIIQGVDGHSADYTQSSKLNYDDFFYIDSMASDAIKKNRRSDFGIIDQTSCFGMNSLDYQRVAELKALRLEYDEKIEEEATFCSKTAEAHTEMKLIEQNMKAMREAIIEIKNVSAGLQRSVQKVSAVNMMLIGTLDALELQPTSDKGIEIATTAHLRICSENFVTQYFHRAFPLISGTNLMQWYLKRIRSTFFRIIDEEASITLRSAPFDCRKAEGGGKGEGEGRRE